MGITLSAIRYSDILEGTRVRTFVNHLPCLTVQDREKNDDLIGSRLTGELFDEVPKCSCGNLRGRSFFTAKVSCSVCGEELTDPLSGDVPHELWLKTPAGCQPFLRLAIYTMLRITLMGAVSQKLDVLLWITNPVHQYTGKGKNPQHVIDLISGIVDECGGKRGWNQFILNFDKYMTLFKQRLFDSQRDNIDALYQLIEQSKQDGTLFSDVLPLPSRRIIVQEHTGSNADTPRIYVDPTHSKFMDVVKTCVGIESESNGFTERVKERRIANVMSDLSITIVSYFEEFLGGKPGLFRRVFSGWRGDFTGRCVISAVTGEHEPDELILPWGMFIKIYEYHIHSKLLARGYTLADCLELMQCIYKPVMSNPKHVRMYDVVNEIIDELIRESPNGYIPFYSNRNPTLDEGSCQIFKVYMVDRNPESMASGHPTLNVSRMNADYDGDFLQYMGLMDNWMSKLFEGMRPHLLALSRTQPHAVSHSFKLTAQAAINSARADHVVKENNREAVIVDSDESLKLYERIKVRT